MSERGVIDGTIPTIAPHPNFRCFAFLLFFLPFFFPDQIADLEKKMSAVSQSFGILVFLFSLPCTVVTLSVWQGRRLHCDEYMMESLRGLALYPCCSTDYYTGKFIAVLRLP